MWLYRNYSEIGPNPLKLLRHYIAHRRHLPWTFGRDAHEQMSLRWLRGKGIEVGAGSSPTKLFRGARATLAEVDPALRYGGRFDRLFSLDDPDLIQGVGMGAYDFAIASHVLEHLDSAIRGFENLIKLVKLGGYVYIAVPDIAFVHDRNWMPFFSFEHHVEEYSEPLKHAAEHDRLLEREHYRVHGDAGLTLSKEDRYATHKHTYDMHGWSAMLLQFNEFLGAPARLVDASYGHQRNDANFVFQRLK